MNKIPGISAQSGRNASEPRILTAEIVDDCIVLALTDGDVAVSPLSLYPTLQKATWDDRLNFEIVAHGNGLYWPILDYDLSLYGMLHDIPEHARGQDNGPAWWTLFRL